MQIAQSSSDSSSYPSFVSELRVAFLWRVKRHRMKTSAAAETETATIDLLAMSSRAPLPAGLCRLPTLLCVVTERGS